MVRLSGQPGDDRGCGDHPLFTPWAEPGVVPLQEPRVPDKTLAERTMALPVLGQDGLPVDVAPITSGAHAAPENPESTAPKPVVVRYGWSEVDNKIHAIDLRVPPAQGGLWWTDCDVLVERVEAELIKGLRREAWCPTCWEIGPVNDDSAAGEE